MSSTDGTFSGRSNQALHLDVSVTNMGSYSTLSWSLYARRISGTGTIYGTPSGSWSLLMAGNTYSGTFPAYNLQASSTVAITSGSVNLINGQVISSSASASGVATLGNAYLSAVDYMVPGQPTDPVLTAPLPTQISATWGAPADGGSAIDAYRVYYGTSPTLAGAAFVDTATASKVISGLTPGLTYYVGVYAHNAIGFSTRSSIIAIRVGIGGKIWDGTTERPLLTAKIWNGTAEADLAIGAIFDGTTERTAL